MWIQLQDCPYEDPGLIVMNNLLLSVGGRRFSNALFIDGYVYIRTNKLFCLQWEKWKKHFPSMNIARSRPGLATQSHYLIVIGGWGQSDHAMASVEIFDEETNKWSLLQDLPRPLHRPSATLCGEHLYILSGLRDERGYYSSLKLSTSSGSPPALTWTPIPQPPAYWSTIATLSGAHWLVDLVDG